METRAPFEVGDCIGGCYQLLRLLGRGGMSQVFEAEDILLSRRVALKVDDDPDEGAAMLVREARALAAVRHVGLPIVHGLGVHQGWTYLVLERLYGVTLEEHIEGPDGLRRLEPVEALPILTSIADILVAVHGAGMAHRDLKPGNVMLTPGDRTVLLDFGIVLPEVAAADMPRCGTPRYLAPEAIEGSIAPGHAHLVDIYSFGLMAFEMFAGQAAFDADTVLQLLDRQVHAPPPDLAALRPDLPRSLTAMIMSCMAKLPSDRPTDMQQIVWELKSLWRRHTAGARPARITAGQGMSARETYRRGTEAPPVEQPRPQTPADILIVEDDVDIRDALSCVLNDLGYRTMVAADGRDALELMHRLGWRPAMILLDLMMPVMDGQEFLDTKSLDPCLDEIPVVLVTAQPVGAVTATKARQMLSVRGILPKPLDLTSLLELINNVCAEKRPGLILKA